MIDVGSNNEETLNEVNGLIGNNKECKMTEVSHVPDSLKEEFYRAISSSGKMSSSRGSDRAQSGSRRGHY